MSRCVVFDVEVYPGRWCVGFHWLEGGANKTFVVDSDRQKLAETLKRLAETGRTLAGYNSDRYDVPVIRAILAGFDPYSVSQSIVTTDRLPGGITKFPPFPCDHIDLSARLKRGKAFLGLKAVAANLGRPVLQELPYAPEATLTDEQWAEVVAYNAIDLGHTWAVLERFGPELGALASLSEKQGQDLRSTPSAAVAERVLVGEYVRQRGTEPVRPQTPHEVAYIPPKGVRRPRTEAAAAWYDRLTGSTIRVINSPAGPKADVPALAAFKIGETTYQVGSGGLHSVDRPHVYYETTKAHLISADVASYYPSIIATKGIVPRSLGDSGKVIFRSMLDDRIAVKAKAKATDDPAERKRFAVQADALKLVLNSSFGKFGDQFSAMNDPQALIAVTLTGQLMLIDLIERLTEAGARVVWANTDGVMFRASRRSDRWKAVLEEWQRDTEMTLEVDHLKRLIVLATNIYATRDCDDKIKRKGAGLKGEFGHGHAPNDLVVADAVANALLRDIPPERTIRGCKDLRRFCRVSRRSGAVADAVLIDDSKGTEAKLPKVTRFYRARDSSHRIEHRLSSGSKTTPSGAKGIRVVQDITSRGIPRDLDYTYYIGAARKVIDKVAGYRHLSRARLRRDAKATDLLDRGLIPVPKRGKAQTAGVDSTRPTLLHDWASATTLATYTGPRAGVLVVDIDVESKFRAKVDKGNSPLLRNRWKDLEGCLVSVRGEATAEEVRTGRARGKLIFRFEGDEDHPLARMAVGKLQMSMGVDVFCGRGMPSVSGLHPSGETYRLEGELGPAPGWLLDLITPKATNAGKRKDKAGAADPGPVTVDQEVLDGLPKLLAEINPELGRSSVNWRQKELAEPAGRTIWVGRCPFPHESGESVDGDLSAGYNAEGKAYVRCKHSTCVEIPAIDAELRANHRVRPKPAPMPSTPVELNPIGESMMNDLAWNLTVLHEAPTGSGKTYGLAMAAIARYRMDAMTLISVPTLRLAGEIEAVIAERAPDVFENNALARLYGRKSAKIDPADDEGDDESDAEPTGYPIDDWTRITITTHSQLGRRGFSKYLRGIYEAIGTQYDKDSKKIRRKPFAIIIDEASEFIRRARYEIALAHRFKMKPDPDHSGATRIPLKDCPKSNCSGSCHGCFLANYGGSPYYSPFSIRELGLPASIEIDADGKQLREPKLPLTISLRDFETDGEDRVGHTTFAAAVRGFRGKPISDITRRTADLYFFKPDKETKQHPFEPPDEIVAHLLMFAHHPVLTAEGVVDEEGHRIDSGVLALRSQDRKKGERWDEGLTFPRLTCEVPRLLLTDLMPFEQLRRFAEKEGVGLIFSGGTLLEDDRKVLQKVWPDLVTRKHPYPPRRIDQLAVITPEGQKGTKSLVNEDQQLVTQPLEEIGQGLVFCATKRLARSLYDHISLSQPTARLAVENDEEMAVLKTLHKPGEAGTYVTYSRGVLGLGANMTGLRHLVLDANAFRAISSFAPAEITPEAYERMRAEERITLIQQNLGRLLRGEEGKTAVLFILNADDELKKALREFPAIKEGCERPPVFVDGGKDLQSLVGQAKRWLLAGGGDWPEPLSEEAKPKPKSGRPAKKTKEDVLAAAEEAIAAGTGWSEFNRKHQPRRQLDDQELLALKARFAQVRATK